MDALEEQKLLLKIIEDGLVGMLTNIEINQLKGMRASTLKKCAAKIWELAAVVETNVATDVVSELSGLKAVKIDYDAAFKNEFFKWLSTIEVLPHLPVERKTKSRANRNENTIYTAVKKGAVVTVVTAINKLRPEDYHIKYAVRLALSHFDISEVEFLKLMETFRLNGFDDVFNDKTIKVQLKNKIAGDDDALGLIVGEEAKVNEGSFDFIKFLSKVKGFEFDNEVLMLNYLSAMSLAPMEKFPDSTASEKASILKILSR
ncbi:hypothetical protein L1267_18010 [Pseudoalteromonas sp. OFAV1]|jgi:hypothetical protein|uniref:hypothetical protein n=1 Tax=Pseudoalteromonas sp. OFAV1 TaxID=2908892 RepID=UPI001F2A727D|nr:hypothetical protein [Pseudoalteromonas sp. OFAV1]MCF2902268.1 hypothetical protein [Pseudoalteromonas sp. OFAV1]